MREKHFASFEEVLGCETGRFFWAGLDNGVATCGDPESAFGRMIPDTHITFDVSNNTVLGNVSLSGAVKCFTTYRGAYPADHPLPGVWWYHDRTTTGPYAFSLHLQGTAVEVGAAGQPVRTALIGNLFPVTDCRIGSLRARLLSFAPVSRDGTRRPPALFHGMWLENASPEPVSGTVRLPKSYENSNVHFAEMPGGDTTMPFGLAPGSGVWMPAVIVASSGRGVLAELGGRSCLEWFNETWEFFRKMTGHLEMPADPFAAEFLPRMMNLCFCAVGMTPSGAISGANWGSYPAIKPIFMKDMGYTTLPFHALDPELCRRVLLWYLDKSVRRDGDKVFEGHALRGGVTYSIANSLTPVVMAGLYYRTTADRAFFAAHPEVITTVRELLDELEQTRITGTYLFPSDWVSDGPARGDYHTGSNVVAWYSFSSAALLAGDILGDPALASRYAGLASKIAADIRESCIAAGPRGPQYTEGVFRDGRPILDHDGEESDTTLMPFYGFTSYDDPAYQNHARVAMTAANRYYRPHTGGIEDSTWMNPADNPGIHATFPGYITGLAGVRTAEEMNGPDGRLSIIRRLTDVDGSIWWWPYRYDTVVRAFEISGVNVGKSGWAAAVFVMHFVSQVLGLRYDGCTRTLHFQPFSPASPFTWTGLRMGNAWFSAGCVPGDGFRECFVENLNPHGVDARVSVILPAGAGAREISVDGSRTGVRPEAGTFFDSDTVTVALELAPRARRVVRVRYEQA